ncbi:MAG: response regulator transcription factor [Oscillospiraceae bacterium]|nr:response regulator transcription factor [Oscillospiraceae bacterium]
MRILLADDEKELIKALSAILKFNKYEVDCVYDGKSAYDAVLNNDYDALVFDVMMPGMSGIEVVSALRAKNIDTPVILLTAKAEFSDKITGLDAGADDYLTKPFNTGELLARLRALLRRKTEDKNELITVANVILNKETLEIKSDSSLRLSNREFRVFELLASRIGTPISEQQFIDRIFDNAEDAQNGVVFLYISYLRTKLNAIGANVSIKTTEDNKYVLIEN